MWYTPIRSMVMIFTPVENVASIAIHSQLSDYRRSMDMTPEAKQKLKSLLISHEKYVQFPYFDTTGHITVGIGRNLSDRGVSTTEALQLLDDDLIYFTNKLIHYLPFFFDISENRKIALIDMCFNLGINGFLEFTKMLSAVERKDYQQASEEILNSKAAQQCPDRYNKLSNIMLTDEI